MRIKNICRVSLLKLKNYILCINPYTDNYKDIADYIDNIDIYSPYDYNTIEENLYTYVDIDGELKPVYSFNNNIDNDDIYGELYIKGLDGELYILYSELVSDSSGKYYSIYPNYMYTNNGSIVEIRGSAIDNLNNILSMKKNFQKVLKI